MTATNMLPTCPPPRLQLYVTAPAVAFATVASATVAAAVALAAVANAAAGAVT